MKIPNTIFLILLVLFNCCHRSPQINIDEIFQNPPKPARPWVFWYWIKSSVSKEGITADLEAMKDNGIGGAYLIPVQGAENPPLYEPPVEQLSPEWWDMVEFAFREAKRLGLEIAMHSCDGFAVAGGPWITPDMSMQKVVWSEKQISGNQNFSDTLPQPETIRDYYEDIALYAYPTPYGSNFTTDSIKPVITSNLTTENLDYLVDPNNTKTFRSELTGWIQYAFKEPFTCRTVYIKTGNLNYPSHRLIIESSNDGIHFDTIARLDPPRHGWQDYTADISHSVPPVTANFFRFSYTTIGFEPGSEDLDAARWSTALKIRGLRLSGKPIIHQYRGKNGSMWRIAKRSDTRILPDSLCVPLKNFIDISDKLDSVGVLTWNVPAGNWTILRIGHTSTGHTNYIGGKGLGLECDKFDPQIVSFQFDNWFGKVFENVDNELAREVLKVFHIDSWECGAQNWSGVFRQEFKNRRGYDIYTYLPVMAGIPVEDTKTSEKVLYDVRKTIDELITENFFGSMAAKAKTKGCIFSSESIAPVMVSDAMAHYRQVDIPMGEFWYNSPTHDKPNDVLDAISAAHIYGKPIVQSEAFTTLRMDWNENPALLKTLGDRNFALGINRFVFHVFAQNPWMDRKPGMSLNTVGLYFQRDQVWWKQSKAWMEYIQRCQALLQQGTPVADIAVFTGEDYPRRALTPDRLVNVLPGLFGNDVLGREKIRLENSGAPVLERPYSVSSSANTFDPANWVDPLRGYKYDSFNKDALLRLASVKNGNIVLPGGQTYKVLVVPGSRKGSPNNIMSKETYEKLVELVQAGATIIIGPSTNEAPGLLDDPVTNPIVQAPGGKGKVIGAPYTDESLEKIGIEKDLAITCNGKQANDFAWAHRASDQFDIYFISNQKDIPREINASFRVSGKLPRLFDPQTNEILDAKTYTIKNNRTSLPIKLEANASVFVVFQKRTNQMDVANGTNYREFEAVTTLTNDWDLQFDNKFGGPQHIVTTDTLMDWTLIPNDSIRYYSGTATYFNTFNLDEIPQNGIWICLGKINHIAEIIVNGQSCGIAWTPPYKVDISKAVKEGTNKLRIDVVNSWKNRIIGDNTVFAKNPLTWTTAPFRIQGQPVASSGLLGPVTILKEKSL